MSRTRHAHLPYGLRAGLALGSCALFVSAIPYVLSLDAYAAHLVLTRRTCGTDAVLGTVVPWATGALYVVLAWTLLARARRRSWGDVVPTIALCLVGALLNTVLKNVFARDRPTMLVHLGIGHSFPSGHAMNALVAAFAVGRLVDDLPRPDWTRGTAYALAFAIGVGRVVQAHHWASDVVGGMLAAAALACSAGGAFQRQPIRSAIGVATGLAALLGSLAADPSLRFRLPAPTSALDSDAIDLAATAEGSFRLGLSPAAVDRDSKQHGWVSIGGHPTDGHSCVRATIAVNGQRLPVFVPFLGPREYRFPLPSNALRSGVNRVTLETSDGAEPPQRFIVRYVRVAPG